MIRSSVVLPPPLGPTTPTRSPRVDDEVDVEQDRIVAVARVDAFEREHALAAAGAGAQRERHPAALEHRPLDLLHAVDLHLLHARLARRALVDADVRPVAEAPHGVLEPGDLLLLGHVHLPLALELELARDDVRAVGAGPDADRPVVELGDLADASRRAGAGRGRSSRRRRRSRRAAPLRRSRRDMSRWASGSSSSSTSGRRARQAASATSLRWPPESSRVGVPASIPSARRWPSASPSARSPPASVQRASARSWRARAFVIALRSAASAGSASRVLGRVQLGLERRQLGPGGAHGGERVALVAVDDLRQVGEHEPAPARHEAGVGVLEAGEDPHQRRLAAAVGAEHADPRSRLHVEVGAAQDRAPAEGLGEAARRQYRHVG